MPMKSFRDHVSATFGSPSSSLEAIAEEGKTDTPVETRAAGEISDPKLLPADSGWAAWRVLLSAAFIGATYFGLLNAFGVFQNYYAEQPAFRQDTSQVELVGTVASGLCFLGAPFSVAWSLRFPRYRQVQIWLGWVLTIVGLLTASFTNGISALLGTQDVIYGLGVLVLWFPVLNIVSEWWDARRGMAFGLILAVQGLSGVGIPFALEASLQRFGYKTTLRGCTIIIFTMTTPPILFFKNRLPSSAQKAARMMNWSFFRRPLFWVFAVSALLQGFSFMLPAFYLPSYATTLGLSENSGAILLAILSVAQTVGQYVIGYLSDAKVGISTLAVICTIVAAISTFALWGPAKSIALLIPYTIIDGFFSFGYQALRVKMGQQVSDDLPTSVGTYTIFVCLQGLGIMLAGPINTGLVTGPVDFEKYAVGRYEWLVVFTAICALLSGVVIASWHVYLFVCKGRKEFRREARSL